MNLSNFVDVNIIRHQVGLIQNQFNTAIYVKHKGTGETTSDIYYAKTGSSTGTGTKKDPKLPPTGDDFITCFFENGGQYLHCITDDVLLTTCPIDEIVIFTDGEATVDISDFTGINQKILISGVSSFTNSETSGLVEKYVGTDNPEAVAAVAAYYTRFVIDDANTIKDYAFTAEKGVKEAGETVIDSAIENHGNADIYLAGNIRNIGGDDKAGEPITNLFMRIVLQQTLRNALLNLLVTKISYNSVGVSKVINTIVTELQRYVDNGYISKDKIWTDNDLYLDGDLVLKQGEPLLTGYTIHISPFSSLSPAEKAAHQFPKIYIVYGDQYSIRKIVVNGEVI